MTEKTIRNKKPNRGIFIGIGIIIVAVVAIFLVKGATGAKTKVTADSDLVISKNDITSTAKFIPHKSGNTYMEVVAVKASDGTVRTAFNTCQVCYDSGRGYYKQEGNELVCQNCGNRFRIDQVEKEKNGCNPLPITEELKKDDGTNIVISKDTLKQATVLFGNWKRQ